MVGDHHDTTRVPLALVGALSAPSATPCSFCGAGGTGRSHTFVLCGLANETFTLEGATKGATAPQRVRWRVPDHLALPTERRHAVWTGPWGDLAQVNGWI